MRDRVLSPAGPGRLLWSTRPHGSTSLDVPRVTCCVPTAAGLGHDVGGGVHDGAGEDEDDAGEHRRPVRLGVLCHNPRTPVQAAHERGVDWTRPPPFDHSCASRGSTACPASRVAHALAAQRDAKHPRGETRRMHARGVGDCSAERRHMQMQMRPRRKRLLVPSPVPRCPRRPAARRPTARG